VAERQNCAPASTREIVLPQAHTRYSRRDFEGRWRTRLNACAWREAPELCVVVTHRFPEPKRYSWELRPAKGLPVEEAQIRFASWEEASQAGKLALARFVTGRSQCASGAEVVRSTVEDFDGVSFVTSAYAFALTFRIKIMTILSANRIFNEISP
jgi:hypothetical protein